MRQWTLSLNSRLPGADPNRSPGALAAEVEQLITVPMEQDLLNGVAWLDQIRSESVPGLSSVDFDLRTGHPTC